MQNFDHNNVFFKKRQYFLPEIGIKSPEIVIKTIWFPAKRRMKLGWKKIGRIFAIFFFWGGGGGQCFCNFRSSQKIWLLSFLGKRFVFILPKDELGYILGDFFTNSFGHPDQNLTISLWRCTLPRSTFCIGNTQKWTRTNFKRLHLT
jgi:hypothetical protein